MTNLPKSLCSLRTRPSYRLEKRGTGFSIKRVPTNCSEEVLFASIPGIFQPVICVNSIG
jgi:hypothetical protein